MTTALQLVNKATSLIGVRGAGEILSADDAAECLSSLNSMLDSWRTESLYAYAKQRVTATLPAGVNTATIGPAGTFVVTPRPIRIEVGSFFTSGQLDYEIKPITAQEFNGVGLKATGDLGPTYVYLDTAYPQGTLYFYPQAAQSVSVTLLCLLQVSEFADLNTNYDLAPGYQRAIEYSLAEEIAPIFEMEPPPTVKRSAIVARKNVKRANFAVPQLEVPRHGYSPVGGFIAGWWSGR